MKKPKLNRFVLWFTKITGLPARLYLHFKVYCENDDKSLRRLPKSCILMSNHTALFDYILYFHVFYFRTLRFLIAEVLFGKNPFLSRLLYNLGGIRVDRSLYDFSFVGDALDILESGGVVGVFPEGQLPVNGKPHPYKPGIVYIALRTDAPIVPVYTDGRYGFFKRAGVMIGEKIYLRDYCKTENPSPEEMKMLLKLLEDKTYHLKEELERKKSKK